MIGQTVGTHSVPEIARFTPMSDLATRGRYHRQHAQKSGGWHNLASTSNMENMSWIAVLKYRHRVLNGMIYEVLTLQNNSHRNTQ